MTVEALAPHGFCQGVVQAVQQAEAALAEGPLFCLHPPIHNESVCAALVAKGLRPVASLAEIPAGGRVLLSAHGTRPAIRAAAQRRGLSIVDATCPFVARLHLQARTFAAQGVPVIIIGHAGHVEVEGLVGEVEAAGGTCAVVASESDLADLPFTRATAVGALCQTTFDGEAAAQLLATLSARCPQLRRPAAAAICTATRDRQEAVRAFVRHGGDGVLVLGSAESSNTRRLAEVACLAGARRVVRAATLDEVAASDFGGISRMGVTAGASTPETFFQSVLSFLGKRGIMSMSKQGGQQQ